MTLFSSARFRAVLVIIPLLIAAGCKPNTKARAGAPAVPVRTAVAVQQDVPITRAAVGTVQPLHSVSILSQVEGVVTQVHFRDGDDVKAGAPLVTLDRRPFQAALQAAEAQLALAKANEAKAAADFDRYEKLHQQNAVSDADYTQYSAAAAGARATVAVQEAAVATAKLNLDYTEIRAPIDGRTSRLALREGSLVRANDATTPLLTINQLAPIGVSFSLPEADLASVQAAMKAGSVTVLAHIASQPDRVLTGHLDYLDNTVGLTTGNIALRATFDNADGTLWPGQFVDAAIKLGELPQAVVVPATALITGQQGEQLFVVKPDNTIEVRIVHPGITSGDLTVTDGIKPGEQVVIDGQIRLVKGTPVTIENAPRDEVAGTNAPAPKRAGKRPAKS
jgi:multidrug efflux system membrane fusion protein